jgi:hypothetical protein
MSGAGKVKSKVFFLFAGNRSVQSWPVSTAARTPRRNTTTHDIIIIKIIDLVARDLDRREEVKSWQCPFSHACSDKTSEEGNPGQEVFCFKLDKERTIIIYMNWHGCESFWGVAV